MPASLQCSRREIITVPVTSGFLWSLQNSDPLSRTHYQSPHCQQVDVALSVETVSERGRLKTSACSLFIDMNGDLWALGSPRCPFYSLSTCTSIPAQLLTQSPQRMSYLGRNTCDQTSNRSGPSTVHISQGKVRIAVTQHVMFEADLEQEKRISSSWGFSAVESLRLRPCTRKMYIYIQMTVGKLVNRSLDFNVLLAIQSPQNKRWVKHK